MTRYNAVTSDLAQTPSRTMAGKGVPEPLVRGPPQTPGQPGNGGPANLFPASPRPAPPSGGLLERVVNAIVGDNDAEQRLVERSAEWRNKETKLQERIRQLEAQLQVRGRTGPAGDVDWLRQDAHALGHGGDHGVANDRFCSSSNSSNSSSSPSHCSAHRAMRGCSAVRPHQKPRWVTLFVVGR